MKLWDFVCTNSECGYADELLVSKEEEDKILICPECSSDMCRSLGGGRLVYFDQEKRRQELKRRSQKHTSDAIKDGRPLTENESNVCSDPVWRNKTRAKNTSSQTIAQHKYDHLK
jgi:predicted nucleic acid-binding Zn ribbon protein